MNALKIRSYVYDALLMLFGCSQNAFCSQKSIFMNELIIQMDRGSFGKWLTLGVALTWIRIIDQC